MLASVAPPPVTLNEAGSVVGVTMPGSTAATIVYRIDSSAPSAKSGTTLLVAHWIVLAPRTAPPAVQSSKPTLNCTPLAETPVKPSSSTIIRIVSPGAAVVFATERRAK